ncbi:MAG TPA: histidine--tRNA ligase [Mycobacteriales bacterium]|nr:histidine--tRNA ligase [Mycobacteriales bacterium]
MARTAPLSGFPEWLPEERIVEQYVLDTLRQVYELHGFSSLETRAVEPLDQLLRKGEIDKEVYLLRRMQAEEGEGDKGLGLHFDLTVPFARYVLERAGHLEFPFRRYQIQKVWRGERPQEGRYREFTQADIDVVDRDELAFHHEVDLPLVVLEAFAALPFPDATMHVNNRKLAEGFYRGVGADDTALVLRAVDKLDKVGPEKVRAQLLELGLTDAASAACLSLAGITTPDASFAERVQALGVTDPLLDEGLEELVRVIEAAHAVAPGRLVADLKIARGLDYYTGTVYETLLHGHEDLGSVCSGGRYDALASDGKTSYPGVGVSIGVSRILGRLLKTGAVRASRSVPAAVLVAVNDEANRTASNQVAASLRARGVPTEVAPSAAKFGKQIKHADRRGIPYVWFLSDGGHSVKDLRTGDQVAADPAAWSPPAQDLRPTITRHEENPQ